MKIYYSGDHPSEVQLYKEAGTFTCYNCGFWESEEDDGKWINLTTVQAIEHLRTHIYTGHRVNPRAIPALLDESDNTDKLYIKTTIEDTETPDR